MFNIAMNNPKALKKIQEGEQVQPQFDPSKRWWPEPEVNGDQN